jgi:hypothetical protein
MWNMIPKKTILQGWKSITMQIPRVLVQILCWHIILVKFVMLPHPYSEEYQAMHDICVVGAYTAYDDPETSLTYILEIHEGLWFGSRLKNSLWNPNQSRAFGLSVCDDPFDPNHELGFYDPVSDMSVLLEMDSVAFLKTRVPSINEVHSCPHIVMTSDAESEQIHITAGVKVSDVNIDAYPNEPQFVSGASESDVVLASVLSALCDQTMLPHLISKI